MLLLIYCRRSTLTDLFMEFSSISTTFIIGVMNNSKFIPTLAYKL